MTGRIDIYQDEIIYEDVELEVKYHMYYDGIGSYEYWGFKGYDKGQLCCDIENIIVVRKEEYTEEDVQFIKNYIKENSEKVDEKLTEQVYRHLDNEKSDYFAGIAEDRYYKEKYGDSY